jgi:hypothetical protein
VIFGGRLSPGEILFRTAFDDAGQAVLVPKKVNME